MNRSIVSDALEMLESTLELLEGANEDYEAKRYPVRPIERGEFYEVEDFACTLEGNAGLLIETLDDWLRGRITNDQTSGSLDLINEIENCAKNVEIVNAEFKKLYIKTLSSARSSLEWIAKQQSEQGSTKTDYYIYFHKDTNGNIFYIGKGRAKRAWSKKRHPVWVKYVEEHLYGEYSVELHKQGLSEAEAEEMESALIGQYGAQLVNWSNPGRNFDYEMIEVYHQSRNANRDFVAATRDMEGSDPAAAIERYQKALKTLFEYESLTREHGLVASLNKDMNNGDLTIIDRLTLMLKRAGRLDEASSAARVYFDRFPSARDTVQGKLVLKRCG